MVIDANQAFDINFSRALVYPDACFILDFLDSTDRRGDAVAAPLDLWTDQGVTFGISTHVFQEVVGVLLRNEVKRSLEIQHSIEIGRRKLKELDDDQIKELIPESAQFIYKIARQVKMIDGRGRLQGSVSFL